MQTICEDDDVLFQWNLLEMDDDPTSYDMELLSYIITLWLTVRGYSVSKCWMERYKQTEATSTRKKKKITKRAKQKCNCQLKQHNYNIIYKTYIMSMQYYLLKWNIILSS